MNGTKKTIEFGLPVSFLDALGLALAAILLLMFTNLASLQSKEMPPERYHLFIKACFVEVGTTLLWNMKWKLHHKEVIRSEITVTSRKVFRTIFFSQQNSFQEPELFTQSQLATLKQGDMRVTMSASGEIEDGLKQKEPSFVICYNLNVGFPVDEEPEVVLEIERATVPLQLLNHDLTPRVVLPDPKFLSLETSSCWEKIVIAEEKAGWGNRLVTAHPMPMRMELTIYSTGASLQKPLQQMYSWALPPKTTTCSKKIIFRIQQQNNQLAMTQQGI